MERSGGEGGGEGGDEEMEVKEAGEMGEEKG